MIIRTVAFGTEFIGLYFSFSGNKLFISPRYQKLKVLEKLQEKVKIIQPKIETNLLGIFLAGNSNNTIAPFNAEGITYYNPKHNALGNLIVANDKGAIISPLLKEEKEKIKELLNVKNIAVTSIAGLQTPGSTILANNKGAIVHPSATEEELNIIEKALDVNVEYGTIANNDFVGAFAAVNDEIAIVPETIRAPELTYILEILEIE